MVQIEIEKFYLSTTADDVNGSNLVSTINNSNKNNTFYVYLKFNYGVRNLNANHFKVVNNDGTDIGASVGITHIITVYENLIRYCQMY